LSAEDSLSPSINVYSAVIRRLVDGFTPGFEFAKFSKRVAIELSEAYSCCDPGLKELLDIASSMINEVYEAALRSFDVVLMINIEAESRIVVHTKSPFMPLEIGIAWHPYLNLPYIPSTALKGVLRAYIEELKTKERSVCDISFEELIGSTSKASGIFVSDALPVKFSKKTLIEPDVLTPHYSEARADTEYGISEVQAKPVPIVFPTIAPGTTLRFVMAVHNRGSTMIDSQKAKCLVKELPSIIEKALEYGIGAKTSVGYGAVKISVERNSVDRGGAT